MKGKRTGTRQHIIGELNHLEERKREAELEAKRKRAEADLAWKEHEKYIAEKRKQLTRVELSIRRYEFIKQLVMDFQNYKKKEYAVQIRRTIIALLPLYTRRQILALRRTLARKSPGKSLVQALTESLIILPSEQYLQVESLYEHTIKINSSGGITTTQAAFVKESSLNRKGVLRVVGHELDHWIENEIGPERDAANKEVLAEGRSMFIQSLLSERQRNRMLRLARVKLDSEKFSETYSESNRIGRQTFLLANEIRATKGLRSAQDFFKALSEQRELKFETTIKDTFERIIRAK